MGLGWQEGGDAGESGDAGLEAVGARGPGQKQSGRGCLAATWRPPRVLADEAGQNLAYGAPDGHVGLVGYGGDAGNGLVGNSVRGRLWQAVAGRDGVADEAVVVTGAAGHCFNK